MFVVCCIKKTTNTYWVVASILFLHKDPMFAVAQGAAHGTGVFLACARAHDVKHGQRRGKASPECKIQVMPFQTLAHLHGLCTCGHRANCCEQSNFRRWFLLNTMTSGKQQHGPSQMGNGKPSTGIARYVSNAAILCSKASLGEREHASARRKQFRLPAQPRTWQGCLG